MGIPDHLTCLLRNRYAGREAIIRTGHGTKDCFKIWKGVRQSCIMSPCLFNLYVKYISEMPSWMSTSWNQDCWEKYQEPQICRWYYPYVHIGFAACSLLFSPLGYLLCHMLASYVHGPNKGADTIRDKVCLVTASHTLKPFLCVTLCNIVLLSHWRWEGSTLRDVMWLVQGHLVCVLVLNCHLALPTLSSSSIIKLTHPTSLRRSHGLEERDSGRFSSISQSPLGCGPSNWKKSMIHRARVRESQVWG